MSQTHDNDNAHKVGNSNFCFAMGLNVKSTNLIHFKFIFF